MPECVVRIVFNNEQVIGKRYSVKVTLKNVSTNVITSHAYLKYICVIYSDQITF